jgi:asparagine synthase (glutamine-hydrolysing)
MCGIAGIVRWDGQPVTEHEVRAMCRVMSHRGPDDEGVYINSSVGLGMRRLSIIDVSGGHQPLSNEDGSVWAVFNGEIYNYRELREYLERRGHRFCTESDTETLVHLYEEEGAGFVRRLRGMFAFAIWDASRQQLLLGRDRLGIKPLYYAASSKELVFASELKALLELPSIDRSLDWHGVGHLFMFGTTSASQSIIAGIHKLEPARLAIAARGQTLKVERYWDVAFEPDYSATEHDLGKRLEGLLHDAVKAHMVSDVPVGAFLSGGIDSSAVVAAMTRLSPAPVKTFSIGFADDGFNELAHARQVADACGTEHHELVLTPDAIEILDDLVWHLDEPFGDTSAIPTYMVSKLASAHVKVVLTGDGGDELFAGYDKYVVEQREQTRDRIPRPLRTTVGALAGLMPEGMRGRRFLRHLALDGHQRYVQASMFFSAEQLSNLFDSDVLSLMAASDPRTASLECLSASDHWLSAAQYRDLHTYLPLDVLTKVDRMSMAHSIEARPPLLDHRLVEFAASIPPDLQLRGATTKYLFKRAMRGLLPDAIIDRGKKGFAVPLAQWFRGRLSGFARELLLSPSCRRRGILRPKYLERLLALHDSGRDLDLQLWTAMSFELWCRRFLDGKRSHTVEPLTKSA